MNQPTKADIERYLEKRVGAWSPTTLRSAKHSLNCVVVHLDGDPETLWSYLEANQKPYTRVTTWTRATGFWEWWIDNTEGADLATRNIYSKFRKDYARRFKYTYVRRPSSVSFKDAEDRIKRIPHVDVRKKALEILYTGMRYAESFTYDAQKGEVIGKGGKPRDILSFPQIAGPGFAKCYMTFWRHLKKVGLKPHDLRKIFATNLFRRGKISIFDFCSIMGWSSIETGMAYVETLNKTKRREHIYDALAGISGNGMGDVP